MHLVRSVDNKPTCVKKKMFQSAILACALLVTLLINPRCISTQELMCCSHATGSCRSACEQISLVRIAANGATRNQTFEEVEKFCSSHLSSFWECLNATFKEIARGESWPGRICCTLPQSESCRRACVTATTSLELSQGCRQSDEIAFFSCLDRQEAGEACCEHANKNLCRNACLDIFKSHLTPTVQQRTLVLEQCEANSPKVLNCIKNFTKVTPATDLHKKMHCCDKSNKSKCRDTCKFVLKSKTTLQESIVDSLETGGCGPPLLDDQFWQCFFPSPDPVSTSVEVSRIDRVGMDSAKWHCCQKASTSECRKLCSKTFTKDWSTVSKEFNAKCLNQIFEENLRNCIDEVDEPCELGCDGLSFCTNFNNRPTDLFRSCTLQADEAARNDVTLWQSQNELSLPGFILPLKNISECSPNTWKAVACVLQVKPCSRHSHANQICRDVCLDILSKCLDQTRIAPGLTPESICATLSPDSPEVSCISLQKFLRPSGSPYERIDGQVSSPCKGDPCEPDQICTVKKTCAPGKPCLPFKCSPGCKLGEVSQFMVPEGVSVRIPSPNNPKGCLKICKCSKGRIDECQPLLCVLLSACWMGNNQQKDHGAIFQLECNTCSCFAGEIICSKKQCESTVLSGKNTAYTTLPCNCPPHYSPVCGRNGNVYPSACLARCAGLSDSDIEFGACQDPCRNNPCPIGQKCVPDPQICLSLKHKPCQQFQCVNGTTNCHNLPEEPVCDTDNVEFGNICLLAHHNSKLAYRGPCLKNCKPLGEVCAINGRTYLSECAAWADFVTVDYQGTCATVGLISAKKVVQCPDVRCPPLADPDCMGVTPPGACCPICGGVLKLLYSENQITRALYLQEKSTSALTLYALLKALDRQIQVAQCSLSGFLTVELDIFVSVKSTEKRPSQLQLEACVREAEKIASLVNRQSPRVVSELSLSCLTAATVVHTQLNGSFRPHLHAFNYLLALILISCFT